MKKYAVTDILDIVIIPLITYLVVGLLLIQLCLLPVSSLHFAVWGVMAGIVLGICRWFPARAVTIGMMGYELGMILWVIFFIKSNTMEHVIIILISLFSIYLLQFLMKKRIIKVLAGVTVMGIMVYNSILGEEFSRILIVSAIILFLNAISEMIAFFYSGNAKSLICIYAAVAFMTLLFPVSKEPYGWDFVFRIKNSLEKAVEWVVTEIQYQFEDVGVDGIFHYKSTGYSDSGMDLTQGILDKDVEQLLIEGDRTKRNLYLKGNVCDVYKGNTWETGENIMDKDYRIDTLMALYAIFHKTGNEEELKRFIKIGEQKVILQNIKTQSLFYPAKILDISVENVAASGDNLRSGQVNKRGYSYTYRFVDIDYASSYMMEILEESSQIIYEEEEYDGIYVKLKELFGVEMEKVPFEEFCQKAETYRQNIYDCYLVTGSEVSSRVTELAENIVAGCGSSYEMSKKLEKYLYQYHYNKEICVPENVNVLDWFLFEGKEGYCAHYATALSMMLRCQKIPSRVVEGFLVDYQKRTGLAYSISGEMSHVWVEAYLDGFGWIRLEPTVINAGNANTAWYFNTTDVEEVEDDNAGEILETEEEKEQQTVSWLLLLKLLGVMAILIIIILFGMFVHKRIILRKSDDPDVVFMNLLSRLEKRYGVKNPSETITEYFGHLCSMEEVPETVKERLIKAGRLMECYWYGNKTISVEDVKEMKRIGEKE
ncbi:MAG: transglutaminase-like domain-containing protein [Thermoflexaceae bacterium]|nr:transglutaminase-like domain-containing protein [Thermoflexaceae bacterium]